jgi:single-strand DNA-binding protein
MNSVQTIGRLTADPEPIKLTTSGPVTTFRIAVARPKGSSREADFFTVEVWQRLAHACADHLRQGSEVAIEGRLDQREWRNDNGPHERVVIVGRVVDFLRTTSSGATQAAEPVDDAIPF